MPRSRAPALSEVGKAIVQLDDMTQQNAALAGRRGRARVLSDQADHMRELLAFKIDDTAPIRQLS